VLFDKGTRENFMKKIHAISKKLSKIMLFSCFFMFFMPVDTLYKIFLYFYYSHDYKKLKRKRRKIGPHWDLNQGFYEIVYE